MEIYLDNAAATIIDRRVAKVCKQVEKTHFANPSSFNRLGSTAKRELDRSRQTVARFFGCKENEVIFTSSASEANTLAILGLARANPDKKKIILSPVEHSSVISAANYLKQKGYIIHYLKVDSNGVVDLDDLAACLSKDTLLVSVMYANNEIGTIQPLIKVGKIINNYRRTSNSIFPVFHTDACQAAGYLNMNVNGLGADLVVINGNKIHGPKGVAALYIKRGIKLEPIVFGGGQELGLRAGTENLPGISGLAKAVSLLNKNDAKRVSKIRDVLINDIVELIPDARLNGSIGLGRLPSNINFSFSGLSSETVLVELDKNCIYAGSGSACTSRSVEPSHVLKAIGVPKSHINGAIRLSLSRLTSLKEVKIVAQVLAKVISDLRRRYAINN